MRLKSILAIGAFVAALTAVPAVATSGQTQTTDRVAAACQEPPDYISPQDIWYMRATYNLNCIEELMDAHLAAAARTVSEDDVVEIPRAELERIRTLAISARDAAARIGR